MKNFARAALGQGLLLGWGDEVEAALSAAGDESYEDALARIRAENAAYYEQSPGMALGAEIAGGLLPTAASFFVPGGVAVTGARGAGVLNRIRQAQQARKAAAVQRSPLQEAGREALVQSGLGAVAGAGAAEDDVLGGAGSGAVLGGITGGAAPLVPRFLQGAWQRFVPTEGNIERAAAGNIFRERGAMLPDIADIERKMELDRSLGIDTSTIMNASPRLARQAEMLANRGGDAAETLAERAERNISGARQQTLDTLETGLGTPDYYGREYSLMSDLRNNAANAYDEAYAFGAVRDPYIMSALQNPELVQAFEEAKRIARIEKSTAQFQGQDTSRFDLEDIYNVDSQGNVTISKVPDVRTLDYLKRGLDSMIDAGYSSNSSINKTIASKLRSLRSELVSAVDRATEVDGVSAYRNARRQYAGDLEILEALRSGKADFASLKPEQIKRMASTMSAGEINAFREGAVQGLFESLNDTSQEKNFAKLFANNPNLLGKLKPLFDSPAQFDLFNQAMQRQSELFRQSAGMVRGSQTASRRAAAERFQSDPYALALLELGSGASLPGLVVRALSRATVTDSVANKMAQMLNAGTPDEIAAVVAALDKYVNSSEASEWAAKHVGRAFSSAARNATIENYDRTAPQESGMEELQNRLDSLGINAAPRDESLEDLAARYQQLINP
jgi:hypothetical protein